MNNQEPKAAHPHPVADRSVEAEAAAREIMDITRRILGPTVIAAKGEDAWNAACDADEKAYAAIIRRHHKFGGAWEASLRARIAAEAMACIDKAELDEVMNLRAVQDLKDELKFIITKQ